jgi:proton-dependent oligopeptide transporter, POT family
MSSVMRNGVEANGMKIPDVQEKYTESEPTEDELNKLEHISDRFPFTAWLLILGQLCEQFAYFGTYVIFQNYIQFPRPNHDRTQPGALGYGRKMATATMMSYSCLCNLSPIGAAIVADQVWGKHKTLTVASFIYFFGLLILVLTSIPAFTRIEIGFVGLLCALVILGLAVGAFKSIMGPFMAEQYTRKVPGIIGTI